MATINGTTGNDNLLGTSGNDTINPLTGNDTVDGGAGTDMLVVDYSSDTNPIGYSSYDPVAGSGFFGTGSGNFVTYSNIERFNLTGSQGDDDLRGGALAD